MPDNMLPADITGTHGTAWRCNRAAALARHRIKPHHDAIIADWIISVPGAHAVWHSWHVALMHLRPMRGTAPAQTRLPGATHELWVMALDPAAPHADAVQGRALPNHHHIATAFAAQIIEPTDQAAIARIHATIALILNGDLHPLDQPRWIELFGDAMFEAANA